MSDHLLRFVEPSWAEDQVDQVGVSWLEEDEEEEVENYSAGQPRDSGGRFGSGGGGGGTLAPDKGGSFGGTGTMTRSVRAKATHKPATKAKQRAAEAEQARIAKQLGGTNTDDNLPFDVELENHAIEVKTLLDNANDKITMHKDSLQRKKKQARKNKQKMHTVVIDKRANRRQYYYKGSVGSFRISNMQKLSLSQLKAKFTTKPTANELTVNQEESVEDDVENYSAGQPRDSSGKFGSGGGGGGSARKKKASKKSRLTTVDKVHAKGHKPGESLKSEDVAKQLKKGPLASHQKKIKKIMEADPEAAEAVEYYTDEYHEMLNVSLRDGFSLDDYDQGRVKLLDKVTNVELSQPVLTYRGCRPNAGPEVLSSAEKVLAEGKGGYITDKGYSSTSLSPEQAVSFSVDEYSPESPKVVLQIKARRGAYIEPYTTIEGEEEFLLPRSAKLRIDGIDKGVKTGSGTVSVIRATQM